MSRIFSNVIRTELPRVKLEEGDEIPCPAEETELSITPARCCYSHAGCRLLAAVPLHSTRLAATYKYLAVPRVLVSS